MVKLRNVGLSQAYRKSLRDAGGQLLARVNIGGDVFLRKLRLNWLIHGWKLPLRKHMLTVNGCIG